MKPTIIAIWLLLSSVGLSAFGQKTKTPETKLIQLKEIFTTLSVASDIHVVLTENKTGEVLVEGDVKALEIQLNDGHLQLGKSHDMPSLVKVHVPSAYLSKVYMNGTGSLSSSTVLSNQRLKVVLGGESKIAIRSIGKVTVEAINDIHFIKSR